MITLYPFVYVLSMSFSLPVNVVNGSVWLLPKGFSLEAYQFVLSNPDVSIAYLNTIFITAAGTTINVILTILAAYPLSRPRFYARKTFMMLIVFTMFFNGGLIPSFILVNQLGMYNTYWALLLPGAASAFLIIVARTFFQAIAESLYESAKLDGANDVYILVKIIVPISKPVIAVLTLFYAVAHWNSYFPAMLYLSNVKMQPLSLYLVKILMQNEQSMLRDVTSTYDRALLSIQLKYAIIVVAITPILFIYPFLQKHFVKGVMIGSIKE